MRCAPRASNGPNHLGLCAVQVSQEEFCLGFKKYKQTAGPDQVTSPPKTPSQHASLGVFCTSWCNLTLSSGARAHSCSTRLPLACCSTPPPPPRSTPRRRLQPTRPRMVKKKNLLQHATTNVIALDAFVLCVSVLSSALLLCGLFQRRRTSSSRT